MEQAQDRGEKVVIFAREPTGKGEWDFVSSVWEFSLGEQRRVMPRVQFGKSMWSPARLSLDSEFPFRDLVRAQFDGAVRLFSVDYRTWDVRMLWDGRGANSLFWHKNTVWLDVRDLRAEWGQESRPTEVRVLRHASKLVDKPKVDFEYVRPLPSSPTRHLVHVKGAAEGEYAVFDAASESMIATCVLPKEALSWYSEVAINEDLTLCAVHLHSDVSPSVDFSQIGTWQYVRSKIGLVPVRRTREVEGAEQVPSGATTPEKKPEAVPIGVFVAPGSGVMFNTSGPRMAFGKNGRLEFFSAPMTGEGKNPVRSDVRLFELEPRSGVVAESKVDDGGRAPWRARPALAVPEYMANLVDQPCFDDHQLAFAFLRWKGVKFRPPSAWNMAATAFSADGKRFALKMFSGGREDVFFLGDLEAKTLEEMASPEALRMANDMSMIWVPAR